MPVSVTTTTLAQQFEAVQIIDVRRRPAFDASDAMIATAVWRDPAQVEAWHRMLDQQRPVVVYCVHGHEVSQECAAHLDRAGVNVAYLDGGMAQWMKEGRPADAKLRGEAL